MPTEADTHQNLMAPKLQAAGLDTEVHSVAAQEGKPAADLFDLQWHLAFSAPVPTRRGPRGNLLGCIVAHQADEPDLI